VSERAWTIIEDPTMSRAGCIVRTEHSQIDARLDSRINAVIANTLGDERATERVSGHTQAVPDEPSATHGQPGAPTSSAAQGQQTQELPQ
jgi:flagellar assembly protein FliH